MTQTTNDVISRQTAIAKGLLHYYTGKPCIHGHVTMRFTASRQCLACNRAKTAQHRKRRPQKVQVDNKVQYAKNRELRKKRQREWNAANADHAAKYAREYRAKNPGAAKAWRQANKQRVVLYATTRRAAKLRRTPKWADFSAIETIYLNCPTGMEVDHIIPLRGALVSGLHVPNNLQYLPRGANAAKHNKFDPADFYTTTPSTTP